MKILIVDDEALALARLKRMLNTLGYEDIAEEDNAKSALEAVKKNHFDMGAIGYLVKPFSMEQLKQSIERIKIKSKNSNDIRLMSKTGESYYLLKPEEVYYVKADLSEVMLRSLKGFSYYAQKISDLEKKLLTYDFIRIHRSYLININKIKEIETIEQSKLRFSFQDISDQIESSKDGAKVFRHKFST